MTAAAKGPLPRAVKGGRPAFHDEPAVDRLIQMVLTLASEVSVLADRVATLEAVSGHGAAIEAFEPDMAVRAAREAAREKLLERVLGPLLVEMEALAVGKGREGYWETIRRIEVGED
jgi:hypothetical protein